MLICFTDLDGTLLNHDDYRYDAALPVIQKLQRAGVPVIPNTSKTRAEVTDLRQALGLKDPFVVENGSGIFLEATDQRFDLLCDPLDDQLKQKLLGLTYAQAQAAVSALGESLGLTLKGFGTMTREELYAATQLPEADMKRACDREFSEPFIRPEGVAVSDLEAWAQENHYQILVGNRFCHMLGCHAGKGKAVTALKAAYQTDEPIITVGLGDSPNDLSMLEAVDIPIVVPGKNGPHPQLANQGWTIAPAMGAQGWADAMTAVAKTHQLW